jgi:adenosylmethionine-8-amino-7-oxononanoate aminotransferase
MLGDGVICRPIGPDTLAFCPPLIVSDEQIDRIVDTLASALR